MLRVFYSILSARQIQNLPHMLLAAGRDLEELRQSVGFIKASRLVAAFSGLDQAKRVLGPRMSQIPIVKGTLKGALQGADLKWRRRRQRVLNLK